MSKHPRPDKEQPSAADRALDQAMAAFRTHRLDEASRLARGVLAADAGNARAAQVLGHALLQLGRPSEAIGFLRSAARASDDAAVETLLARALALAGQSDAAIDVLRLTTARRPAFVLAFLELGDLLSEVGSSDEAMAVFDDGLDLVPDAAVLHVGLGNLLLKRNDRAGARRQFLHVRAAAPQRHDALVALAKVMTLDGEYAGAADLYRQALKSRPDDHASRIELGKCLLEMGQREDGEANLRAAAQAAPQVTGLAITALATASHGRFFLRRSAAAHFMGQDAN
jgi:tetratricopeptide (TPR) repeat protein